jgi:hypothetical protein
MRKSTYVVWELTQRYALVEVKVGSLHSAGERETPVCAADDLEMGRPCQSLHWCRHVSLCLPQKWSSYDHIWFSGHDKQEISISILILISVKMELMRVVLNLSHRILHSIETCQTTDSQICFLFISLPWWSSYDSTLFSGLEKQKISMLICTSHM